MLTRSSHTDKKSPRELINLAGVENNEPYDRHLEMSTAWVRN